MDTDELAVAASAKYLCPSVFICGFKPMQGSLGRATNEIVTPAKAGVQSLPRT